MLKPLERPEEERMFTIEEIANETRLCNDTVRRGMKSNGFNGVLTNLGNHQTVLLFTYQEYRTFIDFYKKVQEFEKNYYTASQVAEMAGCTASWVSAIACNYKIERIVKPNHVSRVAYYPKESAEKIIEIVNLKKEKVNNSKKIKSIAQATPDEEAALHPLVTDNRFLKLSYFPDITPSCFEDLDKEIIL